VLVSAESTAIARGRERRRPQRPPRCSTATS